MSSLQDRRISGLLFTGVGRTGPKVAQCILHLGRCFIVLHKAKTMLGLLCLQLNTIGWSGHETSS